MTTKLTYNQFRSAHKGTPQKEISELWNEYKEGTYSFPAEEPSEAPNEESVEETISSPEEVVEEAKTPDPQNTEPSLNDTCKEFDRIQVRLETMPWKYSADAHKEGQKRMKEIAAATLPTSYKCTPTDSWKIWFGPTSICLLINTTNMMGFRVTRAWWQRNYQTTIYVDREVLPNNDLIIKEADKLSRVGKYLPRTPIVGVECKLPQGVKDIQMRGGQAGDY